MLLTARSLGDTVRRTGPAALVYKTEVVQGSPNPVAQFVFRYCSKGMVSSSMPESVLLNHSRSPQVHAGHPAHAFPATARGPGRINDDCSPNRRPPEEVQVFDGPNPLLLTVLLSRQR